MVAVTIVVMVIGDMVEDTIVHSASDRTRMAHGILGHTVGPHAEDNTTEAGHTHTEVPIGVASKPGHSIITILVNSIATGLTKWAIKTACLKSYGLPVC